PNANPFDDARYEVQDPFADPSINHALNSTQIAADDAHHHATVPAPSFHDPSRSRTESQRMDFAELQRREQELAQRELELQAQSEEIRKSGRPPNNFPPFFPFIYMDIKAEIPAASQPVMQRMWWYWLFLEATLVFNCIAALVMLVSHAEGVTSAPTDFGVSFSYLFTVTLLSFFFWYRPLYNAYMKEKSLYYYFYFIFGGLHILVSFYLAVGIPYSGSSGLINAISMFSAGKVVAGVFCILTCACFLAGGLFALFMYRKIHLHYKSQGHTFEDAK
ncbi:scamp family-domain-containing protein, partial [Dimargaris cristalligena]